MRGEEVRTLGETATYVRTPEALDRLRSGSMQVVEAADPLSMMKSGRLTMTRPQRQGIWMWSTASEFHAVEGVCG